ncbi:MAG: HAMP domain-containing histidine kinase [Lentisphaerales bacterium]|jgi:signal transduction histidine kinase|nr:MAG: HAMP domain-containing histidine kinase [Lentisphaerales bacterium]
MKPKLIAILLLIVIAPLVLMAWLGVSLARNEQERAQKDFERVLLARLSDVRDRIASLTAEQERAFLELTQVATRGPDRLREITRKERLVKQFFIMNADGDLVYPVRNGTETESENAFLFRTEPIWQTGTTFTDPSDLPDRARLSYGWHTWFWGNGMHFLFWQEQESGEIVGIEVDRMVLMSDVLGELPADDHPGDRSEHDRIKLVNAKSETIYQWGPYEPAADESPSADLSLAAPLGAWTLQYYVSGLTGTGGTSIFNITSGLVVMAFLLVFLAVYFYRENMRNMREAEQKVSFVNQVSHELKTPLTNIRMYGELLNDSVSDDDARLRKWAGIIMAESQRLSRLITNVLTFAKKQKGTIRLRMTSGVVDAVIDSVLISFRPSLEKSGMQIRLFTGAPATVELDPDVLEQILGNLLNNVEKYASAGEHLCITSAREGDMTTIIVADSGPGIPETDAEKVFAPFTRLSNKITDGVAGTGMGLGISRDLARLHGGDLVMDPSESGTTFRLTLKTPVRAS